MFALVAWLLPGLPLLLAGKFAPVPMLLIAAPLVTALAVNVLHRIPSQWPAQFQGQVPESGWTASFGLLGTVVVSAAFISWQLARNSTSVIAGRTPGACFQTGYWIAQHGSLPIPGSLAAFGGSHPGLHLSSAGFFQQGHTVVPALASGLPMLLAGGFWTSGSGGGAVIAPVLGGLAVLSFGGLVGRLAGRRWAPAGALVLALTLPEIYTSRDAFSEPAVQVLLFGGLSLVIDALAMGSRSPAPTEFAVNAASGEASPSSAGEAATPAGAVASAGAKGSAEALAGTGGSAEALAGTGGSAEALAGTGGSAEALAAKQWRRLLSPAALFRRLVRSARAFNWRRLPARAVAGLTPETMLAAAGGLALGLTSLLDLASLVYLIPAIAVAAVLVVARRAVGVAFCVGVLVGCGYGMASGYLLTRPLMDSAAPVLEVIGRDAGAVALLCGAAVLLRLEPRWIRFLRKYLTQRPLRWLPELGALALVGALAWLAVRPYVQVVHGVLSPAQGRYLAWLQRLAGLKADPTRLYTEYTLWWVIWYAGIATVLLGGFGAAVLIRRALRALLTWQDSSGAALTWAAPLATIIGGSGAILWQPFTAPDQPWASRRLVPVVIPGMILLATWAAVWLTRRARSRGAGTATVAAVGVFCVAAMAFPAVTTSFGIGLAHSGVGSGLAPAAGGLAQRSVGAGEAGAVRGLCSAIGRSASVVIVDQRLGAGFSQVIRGMCGVPVARMRHSASTQQVDAVLAGISRAGRRPVVLGSSAAQLGAFGGSPLLVLHLSTTQYPHTLTQPGAPWRAKYVIWLVVAASTSADV